MSSYTSASNTATSFVHLLKRLNQEVVETKQSKWNFDFDHGGPLSPREAKHYWKHLPPASLNIHQDSSIFSSSFNKHFEDETECEDTSTGETRN